MKILILSDNHSRMIDLNLDLYDYIIHCGDYGDIDDILDKYNAYYVRGNCDYRGPKEIFVNIDNKNILITHGDLYNVKYHYNSIVYKALEKKADFVFFGHTHRADMFIEDNIIFINPGSYQNGNYVVIEDNKINFYRYDEVYKSFDYRW